LAAEDGNGVSTKMGGSGMSLVRVGIMEADEEEKPRTQRGSGGRNKAATEKEGGGGDTQHAV